VLYGDFFGNKLNLTVLQDAIGNVIEVATEGMEDRKSVILQSHLDMVHQNNDRPFLIR
jgi:dipeptidase D